MKFRFKGHADLKTRYNRINFVCSTLFRFLQKSVLNIYAGPGNKFRSDYSDLINYGRFHVEESWSCLFSKTVVDGGMLLKFIPHYMNPIWSIFIACSLGKSFAGLSCNSRVKNCCSPLWPRCYTLEFFLLFLTRSKNLLKEFSRWRGVVQSLNWFTGMVKLIFQLQDGANI